MRMPCAKHLGFDTWAVLGHSFGGHVALEYALRYPHSLSHLILMDTGGDQSWMLNSIPQELKKRGSPTPRRRRPSVSSAAGSGPGNSIP